MPAKFKRKMPVRNKVIETELGLERRCTKCDESYPLESDFFYKDGKHKTGEIRFTTQCKDCYKQSYRSKPSLRSKTEVIGDDFAIEREFERIEHAERRMLNIDAQTKTPSAGTDGV